MSMLFFANTGFSVSLAIMIHWGLFESRDMDPFTDEVLLLVLPYLKFEELCAMERVSKTFQRHVISTCRLKKYLDLKFLRYVKLIDTNCFNKIEQYCTKLQEVKLPYLDSKESFRMILEFLANIQSLTSIHFNKDLVLSAVADFICAKPNLESLTLINVHTYEEDAETSVTRIKSALSNMSSLKHLSIDSRFYPVCSCSSSTLTHFSYIDDGIDSKIDWTTFFNDHSKLRSFGLKHHLWKDDKMLHHLTSRSMDIEALELQFFDGYTEDINDRQTTPIIDWLIKDLKSFANLRKLSLKVDTYSTSLDLNTDLVFKNILVFIPHLQEFEFGITYINFEVANSLDVSLHFQFLKSITLSLYEISICDLVLISHLPKLTKVCMDVCLIKESDSLTPNLNSHITDLKISRRLFEKQRPKLAHILQYIGRNLEVLDSPEVHDKLLKPISDFCPNLTSLGLRNVEMKKYVFSPTETCDILDFILVKMPNLLNITLNFSEQNCSDKLLHKIRKFLGAAVHLKSFSSTNLQLIRKLRSSRSKFLSEDRRLDIDVVD